MSHLSCSQSASQGQLPFPLSSHSVLYVPLRPTLFLLCTKVTAGPQETGRLLANIRDQQTQRWPDPVIQSHCFHLFIFLQSLNHIIASFYTLPLTFISHFSIFALINSISIHFSLKYFLLYLCLFLPSKSFICAHIFHLFDFPSPWCLLISCKITYNCSYP